MLYYVVFEIADGKLIEPTKRFNRFAGPDEFSEQAAHSAAADLHQGHPENTYTVLPVYGER